MSKGIGVAVTTGAVVLAGLLTVASCTSKIPAGYKGVVYNARNGITGEVVGQGWHIMSPMKSVTKYTVGIETGFLCKEDMGDSKGDDSFEVPTKDGKGLTIDLSYTYRFDADRIAEIFDRFKGQSGEEVKESFIKVKIMGYVKDVTAKYLVTEILGEERANINTAVTEYVKDKFEPYGIIIESVSLTNIDPDEETRAAIQKKVNAQQEMELASIQAKTEKINADKEKEVALVKAEKDKEVALIQAEQEREVAEINKEKAIIKSTGEAESLRIKAEAESAAITQKAEALTPEYVEYTKVSAWNGELPKITSGDSSMIVDVGSVLEEDAE